MVVAYFLGHSQRNLFYPKHHEKTRRHRTAARLRRKMQSSLFTVTCIVQETNNLNKLNYIITDSHKEKKFETWAAETKRIAHREQLLKDID